MTDENTSGATPSRDDRLAESPHTGNQSTGDQFNGDQFTGEETPRTDESASASATGKRASNDLDAPTLVGGVLALAVSGYLLLAEHSLGTLWVLPPLIIGGGIVMLVLAVIPRRN